MYGVTLAVKNDADFENESYKWMLKRLGVVLLDFNVNGVVFWKIFIFSAWIVLGIIQGLKRYADWENLIVEWISYK